jgi:hypothetical protein
MIVWQDFRVKRYSVWLTEEELIHQLDVEQRDFWLIHLTKMVRLDTCVDFMGDNHPISMESKPKKGEVVLKSQDMMMKIGLSCYQI